jgi:hypothetical protein
MNTTDFDLTIICCRAQLEDDCLHGKPMTAQIPVEEDDERFPDMTDDGTYTPFDWQWIDPDGTTVRSDPSIVCDACYNRLMPFTMSGQALMDEIPEAIAFYRSNRNWVAKHLNPSELGPGRG